MSDEEYLMRLGIVLNAYKNIIHHVGLSPLSLRQPSFTFQWPIESQNVYLPIG